MKIKKHSRKSQGFSVFSVLLWQQNSVSQLAYGPVGFSFGIMENDIFLLVFHPSDSLSLPACNGFRYFWCCEAYELFSVKCLDLRWVDWLLRWL